MICPDCDGTGWKAIEVDGVRRVARCDCWREAVAAKLLKSAKIPPRYARCTLSNFVTYPNDELLRAMNLARQFVTEFPVVDKGLLLIGPPGIGKTHIAVAVLKEVVQKTGARGIYYDTRTLLSEIKSTYDPVTRMAESEVIRPVIEAELLVLDDLGAERLTDWVEETMNLIVNTRYNERRPTIFTSNYEDLPDPDLLDSLQVRVGFRLHSRLREMCHFLEYHGPDYRELPPNSGPDDLLKVWKALPRRRLPTRPGKAVRAQLRDNKPAQGQGQLGLKWPGGRAGT